MRLLKTLALLLFVLVSVNSFAQSYTVTFKEIRLRCEDSSNSLLMCFSGVDDTGLMPLCGLSDCSTPMSVPLSFPSQVVNNLPAELSFPAPGKVETHVNFWLPLKTEFEPDELGFSYSGQVMGHPSPVTGTFRLPAFSLEMYENMPLPDLGECKEVGLSPTKEIKNKRLRVAANQIVQVRANLGGYSHSEGHTVPPGLVVIPNGEISRMKTKFNRTIPLKDISFFMVDICNTPIEGFIDISLAFRPISVNDSSTAWDFSGGLRVSASPTDAASRDYLGTIDGGVIMFSSDVGGELVNAEVVGPDTISTTFRYQEDANPDDKILGWMEIDLSSLPDQQWPPFKMEWVLDGQPYSSEFTNVYAMGLGQLVRHAPGSTPLSIRLPVIEQGGDPMTLTVPAGAHQLTIKYALFGTSGN